MENIVDNFLTEIDTIYGTFAERGTTYSVVLGDASDFFNFFKKVRNNYFRKKFIFLLFFALFCSFFDKKGRFLNNC